MTKQDIKENTEEKNNATLDKIDKKDWIYDDCFVVFNHEHKEYHGTASAIEGYQLSEVNEPTKWYNISCENKDGEHENFSVHIDDIVGVS